MQGIYMPSKKKIKEAVAADPSKVYLVATSMFGNEYDGPVSEAPNGSYTFVGPDPYNKRSFYGTIKVFNGTYKVS